MKTFKYEFELSPQEMELLYDMINAGVEECKEAMVHENNSKPVTQWFNSRKNAMIDLYKIINDGEVME